MRRDYAHTYSASELADYSDEELIRLLKSSWGYSEEQPFDIIGLLKKITTSENNSFLVMENLRSVNNGDALYYPVAEVRQQTVYVGGKFKASILGKIREGKWVLARVELSPNFEREKSNNPFALAIVQDGLSLLEKLPNAVESLIEFEVGDSFIESWVIDFYKKKNAERLLKERKALEYELKAQYADEKEKLREQIHFDTKKAETLKLEANKLTEEITEESLHLQATKTDLLRTRSELATIRTLWEKSEDEMYLRKRLMERQLTTLNEFIEKKAEMLLELELIDAEQVDQILGREESIVEERAHDFEGVFGSDVIRAVSYIQAYLHSTGIVYRRKVLEDFYALLTTHDLIVLAGDSGSGKTNLIKSFAQAIGGKSVIIPVKPNWTSAEDLLGYYNPLEQKYLSTQFLDAIFAAEKDPNTPYLICLDEMNLARVEYYFADFLSLMEERDRAPELHLYSSSESEHLITEIKNFLALIDDAKIKLEKPDINKFIDLMRDEGLNAKLHELCGFREGDSLLKYHSQLRKLMTSYLEMPSSIQLPANVRIIGAINVDETTHYLSPKILDRAHIMRFGSALLGDWDEIDKEIESFDLDINLPVRIRAENFGMRSSYPVFDRGEPLVNTLIHIVREYLEPLGIEFGLRTVRQALNYKHALEQFNASDELILNNIVLHKILPKLMFDGEKSSKGELSRKDILINFRDYLKSNLENIEDLGSGDFCVTELDQMIAYSAVNDGIVNYWSR